MAQYGWFGFEHLLFSLIPIIVIIGFVVVFGLFFIGLIRNGLAWNRNNHSPILTVDATIVAKRASFHQRTHHSADPMTMPHTTSSTSYFVTFEVESGDRMELPMSGAEYGMLLEGDRGKLTFQGTRYKGFERIVSVSASSSL